MGTQVRAGILVLTATVGLVGALGWCVRSFGWNSWVFGALANWLVVTWVAVTGTALTWRLPKRLHELWPCERDARCYRRIGVGAVGWLIRRTFLRHLSPALYLRGSRKRMTVVLEETNTAEAAHWWAALLALPLPAYALLHGRVAGAGWLLAFDVLFNVYPALLQRLTRARLIAAMRRHRPTRG